MYCAQHTCSPLFTANVGLNVDVFLSMYVHMEGLRFESVQQSDLAWQLAGFANGRIFIVCLSLRAVKRSMSAVVQSLCKRVYMIECLLLHL